MEALTTNVNIHQAVEKLIISKINSLALVVQKWK